MKNRNLYIFIGILLFTSLVISPKIIEGQTIKTYDRTKKERCNYYYNIKVPPFVKDKPVYKWYKRQSKVYRGKEQKVIFGHWCKSQLEPRRISGKCSRFCRKIKVKKNDLDGTSIPQPRSPWVKIGETDSINIYKKCTNPIC